MAYSLSATIGKHEILSSIQKLLCRLITISLIVRPFPYSLQSFHWIKPPMGHFLVSSLHSSFLMSTECFPEYISLILPLPTFVLCRCFNDLLLHNGITLQNSVA